MDYLQTLPPDLLRQTALSLSPQDIINLSFDPKFNHLLTDRFWQEKLKVDSEYFEDEFGDNYDLLLQIRERSYHEYLYIYYRILEKIIQINYQRLHKIFMSFNSFVVDIGSTRIIIDETIPLIPLKDKIKDKLIEGRDRDHWPKIYYQETRQTQGGRGAKEFDMIINDRGIHFIIIHNQFESIWHLAKRNFDGLGSLFANFEYQENDINKRKWAINQIYLNSPNIW